MKEQIQLDDFQKDVQSLYEEILERRDLINFVYEASSMNLESFPYEYVTEKEERAEDASGFWTEFVFKRKSDGKFFMISCYDCEEFDCNYLIEVELKIKMVYKWK
jgi:hypothetical protein